MTRTDDELSIENRIVVVADICSSSDIMEDLLRTGNIVHWRDLLVFLKESLSEDSKTIGFQLYKFTGDGWILLFRSDSDGTTIIEFLSKLLSQFDTGFRDKILPFLESPPDIVGLTFGMDFGPLVKMEMMERDEYVGRAINLACRLQSQIGETDILSGYRVMISHRLFQSIENRLTKFSPELTRRKLKNIVRGSDFSCYRLSISQIPFKINKAVYGTGNNSVEVTQELIAQIKQNRIDTYVINQLLGGDPDPGVVKTLSVEYVSNGEVYKKTIKEGARIQLP
jgi:hypothetical protein